MVKYYNIWHGWGDENEFMVMRCTENREITERYDYGSDSWVDDRDTFWRKFMLSNDNDEISKDEARKIVERFEGDGFDGE